MVSPTLGMVSGALGFSGCDVSLAGLEAVVAGFFFFSATGGWVGALRLRSSTIVLIWLFLGIEGWKIDWVNDECGGGMLVMRARGSGWLSTTKVPEVYY